MSRLTDEQITEKAREAAAKANQGNIIRHSILAGDFDKSLNVEAARAAIIATLTEYAPDKLPADRDEELAWKLVAMFNDAPCRSLDEDAGETWDMRLALYVIKHLKGEAK